MTWRAPLTDEQIVATLERHGLAADTEILGITRDGAATTVNVADRRLVVPADVLDAKRSKPEQTTRTHLFDHHGATP